MLKGDLIGFSLEMPSLLPEGRAVEVVALDLSKACEPGGFQLAQDGQKVCEENQGLEWSKRVTVPLGQPCYFSYM